MSGLTAVTAQGPALVAKTTFRPFSARHGRPAARPGAAITKAVKKEHQDNSVAFKVGSNLLAALAATSMALSGPALAADSAAFDAKTSGLPSVSDVGKAVLNATEETGKGIGGSDSNSSPANTLSNTSSLDQKVSTNRATTSNFLNSGPEDQKIAKAAQNVADVSESEKLGLPDISKSTLSYDNKDLGPNEIGKEDLAATGNAAPADTATPERAGEVFKTQVGSGSPADALKAAADSVQKSVQSFTDVSVLPTNPVMGELAASEKAGLPKASRSTANTDNKNLGPNEIGKDDLAATSNASKADLATPDRAGSTFKREVGAGSPTSEQAQAGLPGKPQPTPAVVSRPRPSAFESLKTALNSVQSSVKSIADVSALPVQNVYGDIGESEKLGLPEVSKSTLNLDNTDLGPNEIGKDDLGATGNAAPADTATPGRAGDVFKLELGSGSPADKTPDTPSLADNAKEQINAVNDSKGGLKSILSSVFGGK